MLGQPADINHGGLFINTSYKVTNTRMNELRILYQRDQVNIRSRLLTQ